MSTSMQLIEHLMRGGSFGHFWTKQSRKTIWWKTETEVPNLQSLQEDWYFGVHPSKTLKGDHSRTEESDIEAISCLYADIDNKNFNGNKQLAATHVKSLSPRPSVIVDSGGGYHCYWLLRDSFILNTTLKRDIAKSLEERWVFFVGGDKAVHDLSRVLRIPQTLNHKYDPPRQVKIVYANYDRLYGLDELEAYLPSVDEHRGDEEELAIPKTVIPNRFSLKELVGLACAAKDGLRFKHLWQGASEGYDSTSEADLAFCCLLAFWTGGDYDKMDKLFRVSRRMRDKWEREAYRHGTLTKALGQVSEFYIDPGGFLTAGANDEGNAQCAYARCKGRYLFCSSLGWLRFVETHWESRLAEAELDLEIPKILKERRTAAAQSETDKSEAILRAAKPSARNIRNCKSLLKPMLTVDISTFDQSLDELNCPNGVLDLRTGTLEPHVASKKFTYCLPVPYEPKADRSVWASWLLEAAGGKQEVTRFLQEAVGYSLTGRTREEIMFYIFGPARGGKGIFTETLIALLGLGKLATEVGMEIFLEKRQVSDQGFDLAGLKATRFVAASESKNSHWLDAAKLKRWTGSNLVTCAHKYGKPFSYRPQFKIWLTSNFAPRLDADDTAGWERLRVISFPNSWLGIEDKTLKQRMRSSKILQGVLAWAVEGAIRWYKNPKRGLVAPEVILVETRQARGELDWVSRWVTEEGLINTGDGDDRVTNAALIARYEDWCAEQGVSPKKLAGLKASLGRLGFQTKSGPFKIGGKTCRGLHGARFEKKSFRESLSTMRQGSGPEFDSAQETLRS